MGNSSETRTQVHRLLAEKPQKKPALVDNALTRSLRKCKFFHKIVINNHKKTNTALVQCEKW